MDNMKKINNFLNVMEKIVNDDQPQAAPSAWQVGVDLGTADVVVTVVDKTGRPLAAFLEWSEVVRDGVVLDYWGAISIVKDLIKRAEKKLSIKIKRAVTSYPPGTNYKISQNVIEAAGIEAAQMIDEPSSVVKLLGFENGAVVDIGGGTTGISVVKNNKIIYSADEPTGGRHATLALAGNCKISIEEAENLKVNKPSPEVMAVIQPVFCKMADIINSHLDKRLSGPIYLSGGSCCFPDILSVFEEEIPHKEIILPVQPLYLTPLAIANYGLKGVQE